MAVYSYKTGSIFIEINQYADEEISILSSTVLSEFISENNLFSIRSKTRYSSERYSFSYNEFSTLYTLFEDYGSVNDNEGDPGFLIEDYGSILNTATSFEDYRTIISDNTPVNGRVGKLISATNYSILRVSEIQGTVFLFQGKSNYYINSSYIGYGILSNSNGISSEKNTESYVGTGKAFGFGSKAERVVASYNNSSVVSYESTDYGFVGSSIDVEEDYGSILDDPNLYTERDDYGLINGRGLRPFGLTSFHSSVVEKNTENYVGSGTLFVFGDAKVFVLPIHYGKGTFKIRGAYSDLKNTESYVGTGRAFGFGSKAERTVVSYNLSSTVDYEGLDYASITDGIATIGDYANTPINSYANIEIASILEPGSSAEDYGSILDDPNLYTERDDYGLISGRGLRPFGLTSFHSSVVEKNTENYVGTGKLFEFGTAKVFVKPIHIGRGILKIRGAYSDLKNTESYVGSGSLFGFGSKAERTVVSYNLSSTVDYEGLDYGSISSSIDSTEDYGSILDTELSGQQTDNYGLITGRGLRPFGLTSFSSSVVEKNTENYVGTGKLFEFGTAEIFVLPSHVGRGVLKIRGAYSDLKNTESYVGSGSLFGFSSTTEAFGPKPPTSGLFRISGSVVEKNTENYVGTGKLFEFGNVVTSSTPSHVGRGILKIRGAYSDLKNTESYVGSGSLFGFGSKAESITASYNLSSTVDYEGLDYGSISSSIDSTEDYGSILDDPNLYTERDDYGLIIGRGLRPFGLTSFSSSVVEKNTENYVGSGTLFVFVSKTETNTYVPTSTGLFKFNGRLDESNTESYVGTGRAFGFGSKAERTTASYNLSSTVDYEGLDYGSISSSIDSTEDYGSILDDPNLPSERDDYGLITGRGLRPYGSIRFSGAYSDLKNTESYFGSGSLFGFSSTTEAFGPKPPTSGLFRVSGSATESITPTTEIGSGSLFTFGSSTTILQKANIGTGLFRFSGNLVERNTESYFGSGSLFGFSSTTEAFGPKPPTSGLFRISGAATQSITPTAEIGSGTVTVRQASQILDADNKTRLVAAFESTGVAEVGKPQAIKLSGKVGLYFQFRETGSGTLKVRGRAVIRLKPIHIGSGSYFIRGSAAESTTPATEIGSGSLFTFVSKVESFGANPPENTALFKFTGSSINRNTESYVGIGLERINVESLILIRPRYPGSGSISITPTSIEKRNYNYIGRGNLFGFGSASEYLTNAYKLDTFVIRVRGSAKETHTERFIGSGSIFTFVSATDSKGSNPPENTALFKFTGAGSARTQPIYIGEGKVKISEGSGRPDRNNKTFIVSAIESSSIRTTEKPAQIKISGSGFTAKPSVYQGKGSLFGFSSTTESAAFSPDDTRGLFKISGSAVERNTESYTGSGSVFSFVGTSYSSSKNTRGETNLFSINGSANESFGEGLYTGNGRLVTDLRSTAKVSFTPKVTTTLFNFIGSSGERNTEAFRGSGSIGVFTSTAKSVFYDYKVSQKAFRIFGNTFESFARSNYNGFANTNIQGFSEDRKINYVPPKRVRIFII